VTIIDATEKHMEVIVDDSQLSLAIGKKGQNVRLAAKLIGWKVDIKSEEEKRQEVQSAMEALTSAGAPLSALAEYGLEPEVEAKLVESGINTVEKLGEMTPEQLEEIPGIGAEMVEKIQLAVINFYGQYDSSDGAAEAVETAAAPEAETELPVEEAVAAEPSEASPEAKIESDKMESPGTGLHDEGLSDSGSKPEETV
jgi:N utilization substance protein A